MTLANDKNWLEKGWKSSKMTPEMVERTVEGAGFLLERLFAYEVYVSVDGRFHSAAGGADVVLEENHIRCLVRKDFESFLQQKTRPVSGSGRLERVMLDMAIAMVRNKRVFRRPGTDILEEDQSV